MIVVQYTDVPDDPLLAVTHDHHRRSCDRFGYEYRLYLEPLNADLHCYWQKPLIIQKLLEEGHSNIVWLDTDALWLGEKALTPTIDKIGAVYCWHQEHHLQHHNIGVIYINSDISEYVRLWLDEPDDGHAWGDNYAFKKLVDRGSVCPTTLGYEWNSFMHIPIYRSPDRPVVAAWHGSHDRANRMRKFFEENVK